mmetsp:Transcript_2879/g.3328  ORF Transcript_2879/g.3328 Transcript_2879/m.3328 type:complete len:222 (+) Transcript_2879:85-750(+)
MVHPGTGLRAVRPSTKMMVVCALIALSSISALLYEATAFTTPAAGARAAVWQGQHTKPIALHSIMTDFATLRATSTPAALAAMSMAFGIIAGVRSSRVHRHRARSPTSRQGVKEDFEGGVDQAKVVLFTKACCQRSEMAEETLNSLGIKFATMELENEVGLDSIGPSRAYKDYMESKTGTGELPQVHIRGGIGIGGLDEIFEKQDSGELLEWCTAAGAVRR